MIDLLISCLILIGLFFTLSSTLGLVRFPDLYTRMHGPTKAATLGVSAIVLATLIHSFYSAQSQGFTETLVIFFLFLTAPAAAHMIAKAGLAKKVAVYRSTREKRLNRRAMKRK